MNSPRATRPREPRRRLSWAIGRSVRAVTQFSGGLMQVLQRQGGWVLACRQFLSLETKRPSVFAVHHVLDSLETLRAFIIFVQTRNGLLLFDRPELEGTLARVVRY